MVHGRMGDRLAAVLTAGVAACALAACGSSSTSHTSAVPAASTISQAASLTSSSAAAASSTTSAAAGDPVGPRLTRPGSTLKLGQTAVVGFSTTLKNGKDGPSYTFAVTVESITPGSMSDFKDVSLTGVSKGDTPTYVKLRIANVGKRALKTSLGDPAYSIGAVEGNDVDGDLSLVGGFAPCPQVDTPSPFAPGHSFSTCQIFMEHGTATRIGYDGSESTVDTPIVWSAR
jgi:hypothetical protein